MIVEGRQSILDLFRGDAVAVEPATCINHRQPGAGCADCVNACPTGAISLAGEDGMPDTPVLAADPCTACGACLPACRVGVFSLRAFTPEGFVAAAGGATTTHVHCPESTAGGGGVVIPCHAVMDARLAAACLGEGCDTLVLHGLERCGDCRKGDARPAIERTTRRLGRWFGTRAPTLRPAEGGERGDGGRQHQDQVSTSRRGFLRGIMGRADWHAPVSEAAAEGPAVGPGRAGRPQKHPDPYRAALAVRAARLPWARERALPWRRREIGEDCTACLACARACPTGALAPASGEGWLGIRHTVARCVNCGVCAGVCPADAVTGVPLSDSSGLADADSLILRRAVSACPQCGQPVPGGSGELCQGCANEEDMDSEWFAMLGG